MSLQVFSFLLAGLIILVGAVGVIRARNPVHAALFLIMTLFGVAVEFLVVEAHFLAAIQIIVYAGAIVILFLFVIMLLGVDTAENIDAEPIVGQRVAAGVISAAILGLILAVLNQSNGLSGPQGDLAVSPRGDGYNNVNRLAETIFTDYVFAFEITGLLLTVAVVGAVVMARRIPGDMQPLPDILPIGRLSTDPDADEAAGADDSTEMVDDAAGEA